MTNEEAIERLSEQYNLCKGIYECSANPQKSYPEVPKFMEALGMALSALRPVSREQVEKVWRGEWVVQMDGNGYLYKNMVECSRCKTTHIGHPNVGRFCPHCGAPMTDEAVDMVLERLEEMYADRDT